MRNLPDVPISFRAHHVFSDQAMRTGTGPQMLNLHNPQAAGDTAHDIVTQDGSELARSLQARGWIVRAGWRSTRRGQAVWLIRLICPPGSPVAPALPAPVAYGLGWAA